jgi:hypothetical protein
MMTDLVKTSQDLLAYAVSCPGMTDGQMFVTHFSLAALPDGECHPCYLCSGS